MENVTSSDALKDAAVVADLVRSNYWVFDEDRSYTFSRAELKKVASDASEVPKMRRAAQAILDNFEVFEDMAEAPGTAKMKGYTDTGKSFQRKHFEDEKKNDAQHEISIQDLDAVKLVTSSERINEELARVRNQELAEAYASYALGVIAGVGTVALATGGLLAGSIAAVPLGFFSVGLLASGTANLANSSVDMLQEQVDNRRKMLSSAGFDLR